MTISVGVSKARRMLPRLADAAQSGEEVVITRRGTPVARLKPIPSTSAHRASLYGLLKGQIEMSEDFDELPEDIARAFGMID